jgi:hypothetical protein
VSKNTTNSLSIDSIDFDRKVDESNDLEIKKEDNTYKQVESEINFKKRKSKKVNDSDIIQQINKQDESIIENKKKNNFLELKNESNINTNKYKEKKNKYHINEVKSNSINSLTTVAMDNFKKILVKSGSMLKYILMKALEVNL